MISVLHFVQLKLDCQSRISKILLFSQQVILIFPGKNSVTLADLVKHCQPSEECSEVTTSHTKTGPCDDEQTSTASAKDNSPVRNIPTCTEPQTLVSEASSGTSVTDTASAINCDTFDTDSSQKEDVLKSTCGNMEDSLSKEPNNAINRKHELQDEEDRPNEKKRRLNRKVYKCPFNRVVFIDSTWNQTKKIYLDERLKGKYLGMEDTLVEREGGLFTGM